MELLYDSLRLLHVGAWLSLFISFSIQAIQRRRLYRGQRVCLAAVSFLLAAAGLGPDVLGPVYSAFVGAFVGVGLILAGVGVAVSVREYRLSRLPNVDRVRAVWRIGEEEGERLTLPEGSDDEDVIDVEQGESPGT